MFFFFISSLYINVDSLEIATSITTMYERKLGGVKKDDNKLRQNNEQGSLLY